MGKLDNKVAIITGGSGGIGRAAARLFTSEGAKVMLVDLNEGKLAEIARSIGEDKCAYMAADVTDAEQVKAYIAKTVERFGGVDVSLLNAGIEGKIALIQDQGEDDFDKVIALVDASEVSALKKTVLKAALEKAKDNPDLLKAAIDQIKAALKIEG